MRSEYEALILVKQDKQLTAQRFGEFSSAMAVSAMSGHKIHEQPIDMAELKTTMEDQMKALADSGVKRQDKLAMLALLTEQAGVTLMADSVNAPTLEAKSLILKNAGSNFAIAAKITEQLHNLKMSVGTIVDHVEGRKITHSRKKLPKKKPS